MEVSNFYRSILANLQNEPLIQNIPDIMEARIAHDLGVSGDDFVELIQEINRLRPIGEIDLTLLHKSELSKNSYLIAMCRSKLVRKWPWLFNFYRRRIESAPITLRQLHYALFTEEV